MDEIDMAQQHIERELEQRLLAQKKAQPEAEPTGECLHCGEAVDDGKRWCDSDCRDAWERTASARRRSGSGTM